jgi:protein-S-isoprenylcysteine O-methyltransferase Ste14
VKHQNRHSLVLNAVLVIVFASFAYANLMSWRHTGRPVGLGAVLLEGVTAALFLVRRPPLETSGRIVAWVSAFAALTLALARPNANPNSGPWWCFEVLQALGFAFAILALFFLGRSFGVVAAIRSVKTSGLYRLVRHPVYAGYLAAYGGYVLENPSTRNLILFSLGTGAQVVRIREEERVLIRDPDYRAYRVRVRYRLIPFVY